MKLHNMRNAVADPAIGVGGGLPPHAPTKSLVPSWTEILNYTWITAISIL